MKGNRREAKEERYLEQKCLIFMPIPSAVDSIAYDKIWWIWYENVWNSLSAVLFNS